MKNNLIAKRHRQRELQDLSTFSTSTSKDLINLSIGDPDFHTPLPIIEAAFDDAKSGHTHYTDGLGQAELRQAVCDELIPQNIHASIERCMITTSACHAIWLVLESMLDEDDEVIIFSPYFSPYTQQIKLARGVAVDCPTSASEGFAINPERLEACITNKTKAIIINSPNNPTGACYSKSNLLAVADIVKRHDLTVIADDIYTAFCYQDEHIAMASLPEMAERTITLGSFSKNYCMTGWRIGYTIAPPEFISVMESINQSVIYSAPSISQRAALHAIRLKNQIQPKIIEEIKQRAIFAHDGFNALKGISCLPAAGGMYVFPDVSGTGMDDHEFTAYLLGNANIRVIPGSAFGKAGKNHIRVALTVSTETFTQAFNRMKKLSIFS